MTDTIVTPRSAPSKSGLEALASLPRIRLDGPALPAADRAGLYTFVRDGLEYDFIYSPKAGNTLFVLLSGFADRTRFTPPVFQRWSWASYFPGPCLSIADPSLKLDSGLGLAWYTGPEHQDAMPTLADIVRSAAAAAALPLTRVVVYASSGGAFAAMKLSLLLPDIVVVAINPQVEISRYTARQDLVDKFLEVCFRGMEAKAATAAFPDRLSLLPSAELLTSRRILYVQNTEDAHHFHRHYSPFATRAGLDAVKRPRVGRMRVQMFKLAGGHSKAEPPELFPKLIQEALEMQGDP